MSEGPSFTQRIALLHELCTEIEEREHTLEKREEQVKKREQLVEDAMKKCESLRDDDLVTYNVGGQLFMYTVEQIEAHPESMLATFISERWNKHTKGDFDPKERIFSIPRSARLFRYVDDFLRGHAISIEAEDKEATAAEFLYYGFQVETEAKSELEWVNWKGESCGKSPIAGTDTRFRGNMGWDSGIHSWTLCVETRSSWFVGIVDQLDPKENRKNSCSINQSGKRWSRENSVATVGTCMCDSGTRLRFVLDMDSCMLHLYVNDEQIPSVWTNIDRKTWYPYLALLDTEARISLV